MKDLTSARERFAPPPRVHVVVKKEDIDPARLEGRVVFVLDILFATTTIVTALEAGATEVVCAQNADEARAIAGKMVPGTYSIAGEHHLAAIPGFASPLPLELAGSEGLAGKPLVYSTTNGTVALRRAAGAAAIYAVSLRNVAATLDHCAAHVEDAPLVVVCAGSAGALNLEDFYAAGCVVDRLLADRRWALDPARGVSDTALAAHATFRGSDAWTALGRSRIGRIVRGARGADGDNEIRHASAIDASTLVAMSRGDRVVRL
jgi:2-phosphosulfolactate phosphatase